MLTTSSVASSFNYRPKLANLVSIKHSQFSILSSMDRFMNCVEKMQTTILVPSRLKDLQVDNEQISFLGQSDAYALYLMLDEIKNELLWGPTTSSVTMELASNFNKLNLSSEYSSTPKETSFITQRFKKQNGMIKCHSSASLTFCDPIKRLKKERTLSSNDDGFGSMNSSMHVGSSNSLALSDDDSLDQSNDLINDLTSETDSETGSLRMKGKLEIGNDNKDTFHLTAAFRLHLRGLSALLNQLSDTAEFLTEKYQNELN